MYLFLHLFLFMYFLFLFAYFLFILYLFLTDLSSSSLCSSLDKQLDLPDNVCLCVSATGRAAV